MVDGSFVLPRTLTHELACLGPSTADAQHPQFAECAQDCRRQSEGWFNRRGKWSAPDLHRRLGDVLLKGVGLCRSAQGLRRALGEIEELSADFDAQLQISGGSDTINGELERAGRLYDFLQLGRLMCLDAMQREESCGAHFRSEYQDDQGHPLRNDQDFSHVACWEWAEEPVRHREALEFEALPLATRQYQRG